MSNITDVCPTILGMAIPKALTKTLPATLGYWGDKVVQLVSTGQNYLRSAVATPASGVLKLTESASGVLPKLGQVSLANLSVVALAVAAPILKSGLGMVNRTITGALQRRTNQHIEAQVQHNQDPKQKAEQLEARANQLKARAEKQREHNNSGKLTTVFNYLAVSTSVLAALPNIAALTATVPAAPLAIIPAVVPACALVTLAGLCVWGCGRFDAWRNQVNAKNTEQQAANFERHAQTLRQAEQIQVLASDKAALKQNLENTQQQLTEQTTKMERLETGQELEQLRTTLADRDTEIATLNKTVQARSEARLKAYQDKNAAKAETNEVRKRLLDEQTKNADQQKSIEKLRNEQRADKKTIEALKKTEAASQAEKKEAEKKISRLSNIVASQDKIVVRNKKLEREAEKHHGTAMKNAMDQIELKAKNAKLESEKAELQKKLAQFKENVKAVLMGKKENTEYVHGSLSEAGTVLTPTSL